MANQPYKCIRKCYWGRGETVGGKAPSRRIYDQGDVEQFDPEKEKVPRHFIPVNQFAAVRPEEPYKPIIRGLRAPIDLDQLEAIEAKSKPSKVEK